MATRASRRGVSAAFDMGGLLDFDHGGFRATNADLLAAEFDRDWIAQRRDLHDLDGHPGQQSEIHEPLIHGILRRDGFHSGGDADGTFTEVAHGG